MSPHPPKRKPGAQPGNANARKHGFYSKHLPPASRLTYEEARALGPTDLAEEIAICRERLTTLIQAAPQQIELLTRLVNALARLCATHFHLNASDTGALTTAMHNVLADIEATLGAPEKGDN